MSFVRKILSRLVSMYNVDPRTTCLSFSQWSQENQVSLSPGLSWTWRSVGKAFQMWNPKKQSMSRIASCMLALLMGLSIHLRAADTVTINEVDGVGQNGRPVTFGRVFKQGEIANYPQPSISGQSVVTWQADVKNRWPDTSVKFAVISYIQPTMASATSYTVTLSNSANTCSSCTGGTPVGFMSTASSPSFDTFLTNNSLGASMVFTPGATTGSNIGAYTVDAKTMLDASDPSSNTFGDCKNDYWLKGPVVTAVIVQDCTSARSNDFGWLWNGTNMATSGTPHVGNKANTAGSAYASIHPMYILYFYPSLNAMQAEYIWEIPYYGYLQDQLADVQLFTGSTPSQVWGPSVATARIITGVTSSSGTGAVTSASNMFLSTDAPTATWEGASFVPGYAGTHPESHIIKTYTNAKAVTLYDFALTTQTATGALNLIISKSRHRKVFWSGTAPGHIRIGHNFAYLKTTTALPYYDPNVTVGADTNNYAGPGDNATQWSYTFWAGNTDRGGVNGSNQWSANYQSYANNDEGALAQREELIYLYNMDDVTAKNANSDAAKGWAMTTGEVDANASNTVLGVPGGGGSWGNSGNIGFHLRDGATAATGRQTTTDFFYCPTFADKNTAGSSTTCGASADAVYNVGVGRPYSRHTHSDVQFSTSGGIASGAAFTDGPGGWNGFALADHWQNFSYIPYLLTGDYFFLEEQYFAASAMILGHSSAQDANSEGGNGFFGFIGSPETLRESAWGYKEVGNAAFIAPDSDGSGMTCADGNGNTITGSLAKCYYLTMLNSGMEIYEGAMNITGTNLTPSSTNPNCTSYTYSAANRWSWGRCTFYSRCEAVGGDCSMTGNVIAASSVAASPLHSITPGGAMQNASVCTGGNGVASDGRTSSYPITSYVTSSEQEDWFYWYFGAVLAEFRRQGTGGVNTIHTQIAKKAEEMYLDSTFNPYLVGAYDAPGKDATSGDGHCAGLGVANFDQMITSWATQLAGYDSGSQSGSGLAGNISGTATSTNTAPTNTIAVVSGSTFPTGVLGNWQNVIVTFNGSDYVMDHVVDASHIVVTTNPGNNASAKAFGVFTAKQRSFNPVYPTGLPFTVCDDHAYALDARAVTSTLKFFNISSSDSHCPSSVCDPTNTWNWANSCTPYFQNTPGSGATCGNGGTVASGLGSMGCVTMLGQSSPDLQIKFALGDLPSVTVSSCTLSPSTTTIRVAGTQTVTTSCTYSDSSVAPCDSDMNLFTSDNSKASTSGVTILGAGVGSATITGVTIGNSTSCSNSIAVTVTAAASAAAVSGGKANFGGKVIHN